MNALTAHNALMVESLDAHTTKEMVSTLSHALEGVERGVDQVYVIAKAAIQQHKHHSPFYEDIPFHNMGFHLVEGKKDVPFSMITKFPRFASLLKGRPINMGVYGGEAYIHMKYMGVAISSQNDQDLLHHFYIPCGNTHPLEERKEIIRDVYIMFRNMLKFGVSCSYLERTLCMFVTTTVSPFASQQVTKYVPRNITPLVACNDVVEMVLCEGTFEGLGEEEMLDAIFLHSHLSMARLHGTMTFARR